MNTLLVTYQSQSLVTAGPTLLVLVIINLFDRYFTWESGAGNAHTCFCGSNKAQRYCHAERCCGLIPILVGGWGCPDKGPADLIAVQEGYI